MPLSSTHTVNQQATSSLWVWPKLVAHRGGGTLAPENTLAAFRIGHAHGFHMMEYDVKLSADGVPILLHDDTLDRTSNGTGNVAELTFTDLLSHDVGAWHSPHYAGEPVPTLYSIAAYTRANSIHSNIEIKPCPGRDTETGHIVALAARELWRHALLPPLLSSFSEQALAAAQSAAPELPRALLIKGSLPEDWRERTDKLGCIGLNLNQQYLTRDLVFEIRSAGYTVAAWTVNDAQRAKQLLHWGCHAIVTDLVDVINPTTILQFARVD